MILQLTKWSRCVLIGSIIGLALVIVSETSQAAANRPLPRFVSLGAIKVNLRTGPGFRYPIDWEFTAYNLPAMIVAEHGDWRKVYMQDGTSGWVFGKLLSNKRTVIVKNRGGRIYQKPKETSRVTAVVESGVIASLDKCDQRWCKVKLESHKLTGWIRQNMLWGILPHEFQD
jgi:SH3-like domain-containing protein